MKINMLKKFLVIFTIIMVITITFCRIYAKVVIDSSYSGGSSSSSGSSSGSTSSSGSAFSGNFLEEMFKEGNSFNGSDSGLGREMSSFISSDIKGVVTAIGNLIFAGVTVILGAQFIWSGYDGQAKVKQALPTFVVAVLFFYLASELTGLFFNGSTGIGDQLRNIGNYNSLANKIVGTINLVVKFLCIGGIVFIGLKYMLESAEGKAQIKDKLTPMMIGIVFAFSASQVVDFIINVGKQTIQ